MAAITSVQWVRESLVLMDPPCSVISKQIVQEEMMNLKKLVVGCSIFFSFFFLFFGEITFTYKINAKLYVFYKENTNELDL